MQWQFQKQSVPCLKQIKGELQTQEQTQEIRLGDHLPDAGRILGVWGQVTVRSKQWQGDSIQLNAAVAAWVLYAPTDGSPAQCVEGWIPMNLRWELPPMESEGVFDVNCLLKHADARILSDRRLMLRVSVSVHARVFVEDKVVSYEPVELPQDIRLLRKTYPLCLMREAGEKAYMLDDDLTLPETAPVPDKLIRYQLQPEVTETKVLGDKVVFRGSTLVHILYRTVEGALASWDFDVPFSQYAELEQTYTHDTQAQVIPMLTAAELSLQEQGGLRLKAGIAGQYLILETVNVDVIEDAYSPDREVTVQTEQTELNCVLELQSQRVRAEQTANFGSSRVADIAFYPAGARMQHASEQLNMELPGYFQLLYYDPEGILQTGTVHWQTDLIFGADPAAQMSPTVLPTGKTAAVPDPAATVARSEVLLDTLTYTNQKLPMILAVGAEEAPQKDPERPSLILRRAGEDTLWQIAKTTGSTVEAICAANGICTEPDPETMLLIPVL